MRNILLTGGSTGIGLALLKRLIDPASTGDSKIIVIGRTRPPLNDRYLFKPCDLAVSSNIKIVIENLIEEFGRIDVLINNAGTGHFSNLEHFELDKWERLIAINLTAPFLLMQAVLPMMKAAQAGRIINISSDADERGFAGAGAYCATKAGLRGLGAAIAEELRGTGVMLTTISPAG